MRFSQDLGSDKIKGMIAENRRLAEDLGINGTPTTIIANTLIPGEIEIETLKSFTSQPAKV